MEEIALKNPVQVRFFEKLKQSASNVSLANDIADLLKISVDGVYRRMRGESIMSMDELAKLCNHYKIPPDILSNPGDTVATFFFRKMINDEDGYDKYISNILKDLEKINASSPKQIIYAASDIPIFHQFKFPYFTAFKIFFWQRAILCLASSEGKKFRVNDVKPETAASCKKIHETYVQIPSIEIWYEDTVVSNLKLIEYAWESGFFNSKEDALQVCKQISQLLIYVEKQAEKSSKFIQEEKWAENEGNFTMYQSDLLLSNNHIFVTAGTAKIIYLSHNTFNAMTTTNALFCHETEQWLKNLMRKSVAISGVAEKQRHTFFKKSQEKISALVSRISAS